jgi:hypothetical protein
LVPGRTLLFQNITILVIDGSTWNPNSSTWNKKGFYLKPKMVLLWGQPKNPFGKPFSKSVVFYSVSWAGAEWDSGQLIYIDLWENIGDDWLAVSHLTPHPASYPIATEMDHHSLNQPTDHVPSQHALL